MTWRLFRSPVSVRRSEVSRRVRIIAMSKSTALGAALFIGALAFAASSAPAQEMGTETVKVGEAAPDFELKDAHGASYRLSELVKQGPVVLEFFRSGGW